MTRSWALRSVLVASCGLLAAAACSGSSSGGLAASSPRPTVSPAHPGRSASPSPSAASTSTFSAHQTRLRRLNHALVTRARAPRPTRAFCRDATAAEIANGPFGHSSNPQFSCTLTVSGSKTSYAIQVLHNGCYVAERRRPGQAIYGCGAGRSG